MQREIATMKTGSYLTALAVFSSMSAYAHGEELNQILVTATRTSQSINQSLASVSVISREDIERLQPRSLQDLLRGVSGVTMSNSGGAGKATSLFLRGTESDHVLVLIDGIKVSSATLGTAPIENLPVAQIERIEIVRGPRSSLYGSEAIGGVIQIFTRRKSAKEETHASLDLGSHDSFGGSLGFSAGSDNSWYNLDLALSDTDGFDACQNSVSSGCSVDPDDDGYRNKSTSLHAGHRFSDTLEAEIHAFRADAESEYDGKSVNESETRQQLLGINLNYTPLDSWMLTLTAAKNWNLSDNFKDGAYMSTFDTERNSASLQSDVELEANQLLTLGFDYQQEKTSSSTLYEVDKRDSKGYFLQYQGRFSRYDYELSLRNDEHTTFGTHTTGGVAWGVSINSELRLWASYATAFKAPTFNELYYPNFGNPELQPEESSSYEIGLQGNAGWGNWRLSVYQTEVDELIGFDASNSPVNINEALIRGFETEINASFGLWHTSTTLTLLDPENSSDEINDGKQLPRRPKQSIRFDLDREMGAYNFGLSLLAESKRYDDLANTQELRSFGTLDLRASYQINPAWKLQGRFENIFDKSYETAGSYNQPGRGFYLTLNYQS
ncbi:MAG: TonB-dependent vitamin B12 receptor [Candidatus Thiodiazotropha sp.]